MLIPDSETARPLIPPQPTLASLRHAAAGCEACPLYKLGTQTVFGEGPDDARVVLVGEQPGNAEDLEGRPFVGPAGQLLREAMAEAGLGPGDVYMTNAVKHFKNEKRGKTRLHRTPNAREILACRPWLDAELRLLQPTVLVCLGVTAAKAIMGRPVALNKERGVYLPSPYTAKTILTFHPSAVLRAPDESLRQRMRSQLVRDLTLAATNAGLRH